MAKPKLAGFDINALRKEWGVVDDQPATMNSAVASMREEAVNQEAYLRSIRPRKTKKKRTVKYIRVVDPTVRPSNAGSLPTGSIGFEHGRPKRIKSITQAQKEAKLNADFDKYFETRGGRIYRKPEKQGLGKLLRKAGDALARRKSIYR